MKLFSDSLPFLKANFHCHTNRSDGRLTPEECAAFYRSAGYDILSVTDHRKVTEIRCDGLLMIPGTELDYNFFRGQCVHILGLGMEKDIEAQWDPAGTPQEGIDLIARLGGIAVLAHPAWSLNTPEQILGLRDVDCTEIFNSVSDLPRNCRPYSGLVLDMAAVKGRLLPLIATDDAHFYIPGDHCRSYIMLQADSLTEENVMKALREKRCYATQGPQLDVRLEDGRVSVDCSPVESVVFYTDLAWEKYRAVVGKDITHADFELKDQAFVRVEVCDSLGRYAWSQYIDLSGMRK